MHRLPSQRIPPGGSAHRRSGNCGQYSRSARGSRFRGRVRDTARVTRTQRKGRPGRWAGRWAAGKAWWAGRWAAAGKNLRTRTGPCASGQRVRHLMPHAPRWGRASLLAAGSKKLHAHSPGGEQSHAHARRPRGVVWRTHPVASRGR